MGNLINFKKVQVVGLHRRLLRLKYKYSAASGQYDTSKLFYFQNEMSLLNS